MCGQTHPCRCRICPFRRCGAASRTASTCRNSRSSAVATGFHEVQRPQFGQMLDSADWLNVTLSAIAPTDISPSVQVAHDRRSLLSLHRHSETRLRIRRSAEIGFVETVRSPLPASSRHHGGEVTSIPKLTADRRWQFSFPTGKGLETRSFKSQALLSDPSAINVRPCAGAVLAILTISTRIDPQCRAAAKGCGKKTRQTLSPVPGIPCRRSRSPATVQPSPAAWRNGATRPRSRRDGRRSCGRWRVARSSPTPPPQVRRRAGRLGRADRPCRSRRSGWRADLKAKDREIAKAGVELRLPIPVEVPALGMGMVVRSALQPGCLADERQAWMSQRVALSWFAKQQGTPQIGKQRAGVRRKHRHQDERRAVDVGGTRGPCCARRLQSCAPTMRRANTATDLVAIARSRGLAVEAWCAPTAAEFAGINSLKEMAEMEAEIRAAVNRKLMEAGVTIVDPATAYIGEQVEIGATRWSAPTCRFSAAARWVRACEIEGTAYLRDVEIGDGCHLKLGVRAEECHIGPHCEIGRFANLRTGTESSKAITVSAISSRPRRRGLARAPRQAI